MIKLFAAHEATTCASIIGALALGLASCATGPDAEDGDVGALESPLLSSAQCARLADQANVEPINGLLLSEAKQEVIGEKKDGFLPRKEFEITDVKSASFSGCRITMNVSLTLHRGGIRRDGKGSARLNGTVFAAQRPAVDTNNNPFTQSLICLRDLNMTDVDLSHTTNVAENVFSRNGDISDKCFNDNFGLWALFDTEPADPLVYEQM
jgi:hypothetical protein